MLEAARRHVPEAPFVHMSTNKVYGDAPNELPLVELATRWEYARPEDFGGIREDFRIDRSKHSIFGASKVAGDVMAQEYGRYFGMKTCCLRGGCLTGPNHSGVELHGFLSYLVKVQPRPAASTRSSATRESRSATTSTRTMWPRFIERFIDATALRRGLQHGRRPEELLLDPGGLRVGCGGDRQEDELRVPRQESRGRPHLLHLEFGQAREHYPGWGITRSLGDIFEECVRSWSVRRGEGR